VVRTRAERYGVPERMNLVVGRLQRNRRGFGFVIPERDDIPDVFIPPERFGSAVHQDRVIARVRRRSGQASGPRARSYGYWNGPTGGWSAAWSGAGTSPSSPRRTHAWISM